MLAVNDKSIEIILNDFVADKLCVRSRSFQSEEGSARFWLFPVSCNSVVAG
jgi:hypothetical protein